MENCGSAVEIVISFLRGQLINHDTQPNASTYPIEARSPPFAAFEKCRIDIIRQSGASTLIKKRVIARFHTNPTRKRGVPSLTHRVSAAEHVPPVNRKWYSP